MGAEPSARTRRATVGITAVAVVAVLALGAWLALVTIWPRLGSSFDEQLPGGRADHLVVERLRGVFGERWELQMHVGYYGEEGPRWRVPLTALPEDVTLAPELAVLRTPSGDEGRARLEAYAYDDGALLWAEDACGEVTRPWLDEAEGLLLEACSAPARLRAIELGSGRARWEIVDAVLERQPPSAWSVRAAQGPIEVVLADAALRIDPRDGAVIHLEPDGAISIARCGELVTSQSSDGRLHIGTAASTPLEIGRAPRGRVSCASDARGGAIVGWVGLEGPGIAPATRGEALPDGVVPAGVEGAVLAVRGIGGSEARRTWAFATRGDGPRSLSLGPPCRAELFDPWSTTVFGMDEPRPAPPRLSFDCETGESAIDRRPW